MLDQLVESKSGSDGGKRGGFLLVTLVVVFSVFFGSIVWSLFAKDLAMGEDLGELSNLVAPVPVPEEAPPPPEPEQKPEKQQSAEKVESTLPTRQVNMARVDEPIAPDKISTQQNTVKARPNTAFQISDKDTDVSSSSSGPVRDTGSSGGPTVVSTPKPQVVEKDDDEPPPVVKTPTPTPKPTPPPVPKVVSGGVVNGKAVNLVKPPYPPAAKAVRASGAVNVQVTIDENGNVISASAVSGHALLKAAAEQAARASKFSPTMLSGQKVKVTGVIVYNFTAQ